MSAQLRERPRKTTTGERLAYRPAEIHALTGLPKSTIYDAVRDGRLASVRLGRAVVVPAAALTAFLAGEKGSR